MSVPEVPEEGWRQMAGAKEKAQVSQSKARRWRRREDLCFVLSPTASHHFETYTGLGVTFTDEKMLLLFQRQRGQNTEKTKNIVRGDIAMQEGKCKSCELHPRPPYWVPLVTLLGFLIQFGEGNIKLVGWPSLDVFFN